MLGHSSCSFALSAPAGDVWVAGISALLLQMAIMAGVGALLFAIPPFQRKLPATALALLLAYLPFSVWIERFMALAAPGGEARLIFLFVISSSLGLAGTLKTLSAAAGVEPAGANADLRTWLLWYLVIPEPRFGSKDGKAVKAARGEVAGRLACLAAKVAAGAILFATLRPPPPRPSLAAATRADGSYADVFGDGGLALHLLLPLIESPHPAVAFLGRTAHTYLWLWALYLFLGVCCDIGALPTLLQGHSAEPGFAHPLWCSGDARELWGDRWNRPVNLLLKRAVYKPFAFGKVLGVGPRAATALTFLASGLAHEYTFALNFAPSHSSGGGAASFFESGYATAFFLAQGAVMVAEASLARLLLQRRSHGQQQQQEPAKGGGLAKEGGNRTKAGRSLLTAVCGLPRPLVPVAHVVLSGAAFHRLFLLPWVASGLFRAIASMFPAAHVAC